MKRTSSILDIDLDYFNLVKDPVDRLRRLMAWAGRPVDVIVEKHHAAMWAWTRLIERGKRPTPTHILHVDEHHDMMNAKPRLDIGNVMYHAMIRWPGCRVFWLSEGRIDTPRMWLPDETWARLRRRFGMGNAAPARWPRPDLVSVCTSPGFVPEGLLAELVKEMDNWDRNLARAGACFRFKPGA